jgi:protein-tyrosine phosphatase
VETVAEGLNRPGFVDIHCHLLPGLDDGPADEAEALEMARILASAGFSEICCTPHMLRGAYYNPPARIRTAVADLQTALDKSRISLTLHAGAEYYLDEFLPSYLEDPITIGDSILLVEASYQVPPDFLLDSIFKIVQKKFTPILAHPERCNILDPEKEPVAKLKAMGCLFQQNIGSFAGIYGEKIRLRALSYLEKGLCSHIATDAHQSPHLEQWLSKGMNAIDKEVGAEIKKGLLNALPNPVTLDP